jgi:hypothetical protein
MSNGRIIGWSDDGWPIIHPDDIAAMGDPVDDSLNPGWEELAERVFGKVEPRQRSSATWLADMKPAAKPMPAGDFTGANFDMVVEALAGWAIEVLMAGAAFDPQIAGFDPLWYPVRIVEGPQGSTPVWLEAMDAPHVRVPGLPMDNPDVVRDVFQHLGIKAAASIMLTTEDADGPALAPEPGASAGPTPRCVVVDSFFSETGERRVLIVPVTFEEDGVLSVMPMEDSRMMPEGMSLAASPLAALFPS